MTAYSVFRLAMRLIGSPWGFFPVAIVALYAHGIDGHPLDALPFLFEWALMVAACGWLARLLPADKAAALPANRPIPPPAMAVSVTPSAPVEASPALDAMKARLPENVARLLR